MDGLGSVVSDEPVGGKRRAVPRLVGAGGRRADGGHPILLVGSTFQRGEQEHAADAEEAPTLSAQRSPGRGGASYRGADGTLAAALIAARVRRVKYLGEGSCKPCDGQAARTARSALQVMLVVSARNYILKTTSQRNRSFVRCFLSTSNSFLLP